MSDLPPPLSISKDDYSAADPARQRIKSKSRRFKSLFNLRSSSQTRSLHKTSTLSEPHLPIMDPDPVNLIALDSASLDDIDIFNDKYEWAVVYENQRGMTLFSVPYYSRLSLLPSDPPAFTIPNASIKAKKTNISLTDYPLPDGNWRWVSKCWMIDMRSDTGEVQHDGFEYNWVFRMHKWRAEIGSFSAGGWVRRRRWIRLMMRPAIARHPHDYEHGGLNAPAISASVRNSLAGSAHPRLASPPESDIGSPWIRNDVEGNWLKCRQLMKHLGRDGRKIELWEAWLAHGQSNNNPEQGTTKGKEEQITTMTQLNEDKSIVGDHNIRECQCPSKEDLKLILQTHGKELLQTFIYPDSRASFLKILAVAGLLQELDVELGLGSSASGIDFWSYVDGE